MAGNLVKTRLGPRHALAGLQAGIFGSILMILTLMLGSVLRRRSVWIVPNLFATTFYGSGIYRNQMLRGSWSGVAIIFAIYGAGGILWGILWRDERRPLAALYGAITGLLVYYVFFNVIWKVVNPLIPLYAPDRQMEVAHILWGMALARSPKYAGRIARALAEPVQVQDVEIKSGEVIL